MKNSRIIFVTALILLISIPVVLAASVFVINITGRYTRFSIIGSLTTLNLANTVTGDVKNSTLIITNTSPASAGDLLVTWATGETPGWISTRAYMNNTEWIPTQTKTLPVAGKLTVTMMVNVGNPPDSMGGDFYFDYPGPHFWVVGRA